jgi:hypothetical protein
VLPDFPLAITGLDGEPRAMIARDVPASVFFCGFPPAVPLTECWKSDTPEGQQRTRVHLERWLDGLLTRVVVAPRLTLELVQRLGPIRDQAERAYLRTVGWAPADPDQPDGAEALLLPGAAAEPEPKLSSSEALRWPVTVPSASLKASLQMMAKRARVLPSALWQVPISEWIFNWRILLEDELLAREARHEERAVYTNDAELLQAR